MGPYPQAFSNDRMEAEPEPGPGGGRDLDYRTVSRTTFRKWTTWPNRLSLLRIGLLPFLVWAAGGGNLAAYVGILILSCASDCADGALARRLNQASAFGAQLDSWADLGLITVHVFGIWRLVPDFVRSEFAFGMAAYFSYLLPILAGFFKHGKITSFHTHGDHASAVLMGASGVAYLLGWGTGLFRLAALVTVATQLEKLAMVWLLPDWHCDVRTWADAWKLRVGTGNPCPQEAASAGCAGPRDDAPC